MKATIRILAVASLPLILAASGPPKGCMAGMREFLVEGGFSGPIICSRKNATFVLVGRTAGAGYSIYYYRYRFLAAVVYHGGERLVVFHGKKYIGQYVLGPPPFTKVMVKGRHVVLQVHDVSEVYADPPDDSIPIPQDHEETVALDFSRKPPITLWINGEIEEFVR